MTFLVSVPQALSSLAREINQNLDTQIGVKPSPSLQRAAFSLVEGQIFDDEKTATEWFSRFPATRAARYTSTTTLPYVSRSRRNATRRDAHLLIVSCKAHQIGLSPCKNSFPQFGYENHAADSTGRSVVVLTSADRSSNFKTTTRSQVNF